MCSTFHYSMKLYLCQEKIILFTLCIETTSIRKTIILFLKVLQFKKNLVLLLFSVENADTKYMLLFASSYDVFICI